MTDVAGQSDSIEIADLALLARSSERFGLIWSGGSTDLNVNLLLLAKGDAIAEHVNNQVDVMIVGIEGAGRVSIDAEFFPVAAGQMVIVPRDSSRSIVATSDRFGYLTCHQRRGGLWPSRSRQGTDG